MNACDTDQDSLWDLSTSCSRALCVTLLPTILVLGLGVSRIPFPDPFRRLAATVKPFFGPFLTVSEAEALDVQALGTEGDSVTNDGNREALELQQKIVRWRAALFVMLGVVECLLRIAIGVYFISATPSRTQNSFIYICSAIPWTYTAVRPISRPITTVPYDLLLIYTVLFCGGALSLGGIIYDQVVFDVPAQTILLATSATDMAISFVLLSSVLTMPMGYWSSDVNSKDIGSSVSPEDYCTLFDWVTFRWINPLIRLGKNTTLHEKDVWELSPTMQSRPLFFKFMDLRRKTLLRRIIAANSFDMIFDFVLTIISVVLNYTAPFFLKRILSEIEREGSTKESRAKAYIYAVLALICSLLKAQADVQHLWLGRRASVRVRGELTASIYDKALKRKDFSGVVSKDAKKDAPPTKGASKAETKAQAKAAKDKAKKADDPKAGADIGKIVNLMSSDTNRLARVISTIHIIYAAPFEIIIAGLFLYQLLGVSAFAGFFVLVLAWPLNRFLVNRRVRIQKGTLAARDKRMGTLSELISAIKIIKFFAWEDRWISRVLDDRATEMKWMVKARINMVIFMFLWACAPIFVSIAAFFAYVMSGHQLTISTAFTALSLFSMVRAPLNVIPEWTVNILQAGIALDRISVYLDEDEVTEQVCSLKKTHFGPDATSDDDEGLGLEDATLRWNRVSESAKGGKGPSRNGDVSSATSISGDTAVADSSGSSTEDEDNKGDDRGFRLREISVVFPENKLTVITGPTASGKTALLLAVLGEMTLLKGRIIMSKDSSRVDEHGLMRCISYASQTPWLRHQSIKDNILFGYPLDEERYRMVIECCALNPDLNLLEDGDATEIGARGINLSGGQKARVALARAVYARTKYVLLDDPLSAVDSHTARFLYERLLLGPLLEHRTVVLVTHHVELVLPGTNYVVHMLNGRIDKQGPVAELKSAGIIDSIATEEAASAPVDSGDIDAAVQGASVIDGTQVDTAKSTMPRKFVKEEHRETGSVKFSVYNKYLQASSYWTWSIILLLLLLRQVLDLGEKLWIKVWSGAYETGSLLSSNLAGPSYLRTDLISPQTPFISAASNAFGSHNWPNAAQHPLFYIGVYAAISLSFATTVNVSGAIVYTGALRASRILFRELLETVVRATFRIHDTTPQGEYISSSSFPPIISRSVPRPDSQPIWQGSFQLIDTRYYLVLNNYEQDMETIDSSLAGSVQSVNRAVAGFFASIIIISFIFPYFIIAAFFLGIIYWDLALGYVNTGRDLRRMESNTRSPIYSDFGELLEGIVTVRAFSAEKRFLNNLHKKVDTTTKMWYSFWMTNRWLCLNYDVLGAFAILITTLFAISQLSDAGLAGICITSAMSYTNSIYWACRYWTSLELDLNAVERIIEYLRLPQEPPALIAANRVPAYWPSQTNDSLVVVEDLEVKYAPELPAVLHGVSFSLRARERVGILGRTGSGKSTLAMSILRFVDPTTGRILIDGIDISTIGTHDLRSKVTFIPQDATLFSGTLRDNLDPFHDYEDSDCINVLKRVHLISDDEPVSLDEASSSRAPSELADASLADSSSVTTKTDNDTKAINLETKISPGGTNFSQGQRQLIALARALLRQSSIIILDEATSSIDFATDTKIQAAIREEFNASLLLTIAHRIRTVIDYDRLLVLDKGEIAEFDTPANLINKEGGIFRDMCMKSGSFEELQMASNAAAIK
ncbi:hypothetical protein HYPSUDRAFT_1094370 [Hypholoma sublateritium FD-334 SS-4]|uniref:Multidrug resistance-associated ABC transporter n=1 Tax=Hypholoma sublateritium (strain FD-334 SS-4) TaxID=945553 RepID=A0A0D2M8T8_HYPSF|nr:hypothetical protein HYPSUDRAFT_1094370 [Hypholoma sublateritium FD-334 SS-4]